MKFLKKSLWAALALTFTAPAFAAMNNVDSGTGSSFMLNIIDKSAAVSATFDLGPTFAAFNPNVDASWDLTTTSDTANYNTAFTSFAGAATNANVTWSIFGGQLGPELSSQSFYSTFTSSAISGWAAINGMESSNVSGGMYSLIQAVNMQTTHNGYTNGANFATAADADYSSTYASNVYGVNGDFGLNNVMVTSYGNSMNLYKITNSSNDNFFADVNKSLMGTFTLTSAGALTYVAAVPEADSAGMVLAGLGLMGFIARRRKQIA